MRKQTKDRLEHEAEAGAAGAVTGALVGAMGGPPGAFAGAVIGAAAGALAGFALDKDGAAREAEDLELDREIGVTEGEMGAPNLAHPPAKMGVYSIESAGAPVGGDDEPAEGPMQPPSS